MKNRRRDALLWVPVALGVAIAAAYFISRPTSISTSPATDSRPTETSATPPASATLPPPTQGMVAAATPEDLKKLSILEQILASRNDNDPRLDRDFRQLTPSMKALLRSRYRSIAPEKRNDLGTIVFLLGRELGSQEDFDFLCEVLRSPPCVSLNNCHSDPATMGREDYDRESGEEVTLAYPQHVALRSLEAYFENAQRDPAWTEAAARTIECSKDSRVAIIAEKGARLSEAISSTP